MQIDTHKVKSVKSEWHKDSPRQMKIVQNLSRVLAWVRSSVLVRFPVAGGP